MESRIGAPKPPPVILNAVKNLVLCTQIAPFFEAICAYGAVEKGNIGVEGEILHCVQNDRASFGC